MARLFGRLWSITAAAFLIFIILASFHSLQPLRRASSAVVESTSRDLVKQDQEQSEAVLQADQAPVSEESNQNERPADAPAIIVKPTPLRTSKKEETIQTTLTTTTSATPTPTELSKAIVIGRLSSEDTDWVARDLSDWQNAIYYVDLPPGEESPTGLRTKMNKAREAMPYLTYIIDNYPNFPDVMAFIHPHKRGMPQAWHTDAIANDAVNMMQALKLKTVVERGYVNLRCNNEVGCPDEVQPFRDPPDPNKHAEHAFPDFYTNFFNVSVETMRNETSVIATPCCAQFAVSREQVLKKPKHEYVRYRTFLEETDYDDATSGRVMEYMWHIIFGRDAVFCEDMFNCWCAVYGRCFKPVGGHF